MCYFLFYSFFYFSFIFWEKSKSDIFFLEFLSELLCNFLLLFLWDPGSIPWGKRYWVKAFEFWFIFWWKHSSCSSAKSSLELSLSAFDERSSSSELWEFFSSGTRSYFLISEEISFFGYIFTYSWIARSISFPSPFRMSILNALSFLSLKLKYPCIEISKV